jgi:hypothetical protein
MSSDQTKLGLVDDLRQLDVDADREAADGRVRFWRSPSEVSVGNLR